MTLEVKFFARARDLVGSGTALFDLPAGATVADLRAALAQRYPELRPLVPRLHIAVGQDYATDGTLLSPASDVACFPPVSGG